LGKKKKSKFHVQEGGRGAQGGEGKREERPHEKNRFAKKKDEKRGGPYHGKKGEKKKGFIRDGKLGLKEKGKRNSTVKEGKRRTSRRAMDARGEKGKRESHNFMRKKERKKGFHFRGGKRTGKGREGEKKGQARGEKF